MKTWVTLREGLATTWANKVPTALVAFLVAVMVAGTLATVGRTAAAEGQLEQRIDAAGSRQLVVIDARNRSHLNSTIVTQTAGLSTVERAVGLLSAIDTVSGPVGQGGDRVATWGVIGDIQALATLTEGRWPAPGEALVSEAAMTTLGFTHPFGWVTEAATPSTREFSVVGSFTPREPFGDYGSGIIYNAGDATASSLSVILNHASHAAHTQQAVLGLIAATDPSDLNVQSPIGLAELRDQVLGDFTAFGRTLLLGVLAAGSVLIAIVVLADVLVRRADLGRRRALGATRGTIIAIVTTRTIAPAIIGAALGIAAGLLIAERSGATPPAAFTAGVTILAILAAAASAIPPALFAATRDPVSVLRTP
ncbi:MAG TPA: FtsX-like permease family protein [Tessaracoccus flavescens]|uniref:FtsX-like permease family protein n=2 Tax=Actinomycetes TaxID=1760 RepID=A0A921JQ70_9ACTN|nr:FtsX-like permease family protein [Flaviflexus equikiangi]MBM9433888.1 FtsX-like permease family protein [Flaviflexus equikiangi]HJE51020.1 FtsX-like permease family protein [Tessaracoccus flavescens]